MSHYLCLTIRFLLPYYHGLRDGGAPEWPPSPLRLFQGLVAAAAAHWNERERPEFAEGALCWLEQQPYPDIVAGAGKTAAVPYRMYVPNNAADLVAAAWSRGNAEASVAEHRTEKDVQPTHLSDEAVHYLYPLEGETCPHLEVLRSAARSVTHLGWGTDMVIGNAEIITDEAAQRLPGERWFPATGTDGVSLRTPVIGTLPALITKHQAFLRRLSGAGFRPVPPLTAFRIVSYRRDFEPALRPIAAFQLLQPDGSNMRPFDTARRTCSVAGMLRHVTGLAAEDAQWAPERISRIVFGHAATRDATNPACFGPDDKAPARLPTQSPDDIVGANRLAYLPLPSLEYRPGKGNIVGSIRRVLVTSLSGDCRDEIQWTRRALSGRDLIDKRDGQPQALLSVIPDADKMVQNYTKPSKIWATVTPVILPGRDDRHQKKAERLLRKAIRQAGFSEQLANLAELEWRNVPFLPGGDLATRFFVPEHLRNYPRFHVRIVWKKSHDERVAISGPLCLGGGRHYGLGLFAAVSDSE